jgi:phage N-6-adenine-methyltransferase
LYKDLVDNKGDYNTPLYLFNYLNKHFKFELDPCDSGNKWLGLPYNFTKEDDGLSKEWTRNAFVNPPYGFGHERDWINKTRQEAVEYNTFNFILLPSKTEASWFGYAMSRASIIIFPEKRISFLKNGISMNSNTMGSVLFGFFNYFKKKLNPNKFITIFPTEEFHFQNVELGVRYLLIENNNIIYFPDRDLLKQKYT